MCWTIHSSIYEVLKPSVVPMSSSKPQFSILEAPSVSGWRPKPRVFVVAGPLPGILDASASWESLHPEYLCILGISVPQAFLHPRHLCTLSISAPQAPPHPRDKQTGKPRCIPLAHQGCPGGVCQDSRSSAPRRCHFSVKV